MRIANVEGRLHLLLGDGSSSVDVATASGGSFGPDPAAVYEVWEDFRSWAEAALSDKDSPLPPPEPFDPGRAGPPSPRPPQVFAVALNYVDHAAESGLKPPDAPLVFAKYVSSFSGPVSEVTLPEGNVDWECELVAVMSRRASRVAPEDAWDHVAGVTVGQDISERVLQRSGPAPQFGLAKSYPGFSPTGPVLVTPDDLPDRDDLAIACELNGETMQSARTSHMIFPVAELVAYLSRVVTLLPGDVIFTGTPPGVGMGRDPQVFIAPGDELRSYIEGIGELHQRFVAP